MYKKPAFVCFILCVAVILMPVFSACGETETTETSTSLWEPNFDDPWNFDPVFTRDYLDLNDYDIEISLEETVYKEAPKSISVKIVNKTGKGILMCIGPSLEKVYRDPDYNGLERMSDYMWVRLPYQVGLSWGETEVSEMIWTIDLTKDGAYWQKSYEFTPGSYRITFFFPDGPQYLYFEITE